MRQIDEEYIQTGSVRFGYRHLVVLGPDSQRAAEASECAAEQGAFWVYHDSLYDLQPSGNRRPLGEDNLKRVAAELGLDTASFNSCLDSGKHATLVQSETAVLRSLGVRGTPAFLVNGQPVVGAQAFEVFQQLIEADLGAVGQ